MDRIIEELGCKTYFCDSCCAIMVGVKRNIL